MQSSSFSIASKSQVKKERSVFAAVEEDREDNKGKTIDVPGVLGRADGGRCMPCRSSLPL